MNPAAQPDSDPPTPADAVADPDPPFRIHRPAATSTPPTPLVFASPHSGRVYPREMMAASVLDASAIRRSEDALVDDLVTPAASRGAVVITAAYARAYLDVNREPYDLDASMFEDELPAFARGRSARVAAGLGSIARIVAEGQEIYSRKLTVAEAMRRIDRVHRPYHAALAGLIAEAKAAFGVAVLVDWHSMPSAAARTLGQSGDIGVSGGVSGGGAGVCDMVLGDRFGAACGPPITALVQHQLEAMGYRVARNAPYAGGYTTEFYGRPGEGVHALQVEINRALYLNEATLEPHRGFRRLKADLAQVFAALAGLDRASLG